MKKVLYVTVIYTTAVCNLYTRVLIYEENKFTLILGIVTVGGLAFALKLIVSFSVIKPSTNFILGKVDSTGSTKSALNASIIIITNLPNAGSFVISGK